MNDAVTKRPPALGPLARQLSRNVADTIGSAVPNPPRTMLLCLSRGSDDISVAAILGLRVVFRPGYCWFADKTGMGRSRWSASSY
jgi:hypothetical protein